MIAVGGDGTLHEVLLTKPTSTYFIIAYRFVMPLLKLRMSNVAFANYEIASSCGVLTMLYI